MVRAGVLGDDQGFVDELKLNVCAPLLVLVRTVVGALKQPSPYTEREVHIWWFLLVVSCGNLTYIGFKVECLGIMLI